MTISSILPHHTLLNCSMPTALQSNPENVENQRQIRWRNQVPLWLAAVSLISALFLTGSSGHLAEVDQTISALHDARAYLHMSDFLSGKVETIPDHRIRAKPALYPAFLALRYVIGVRAFVLLQLLLNAASVVLVSSLVLQLTRSKIAAAISAMPLIMSVTLTYLALIAMTESLAVFLCAASMFLVARHAHLQDIDRALRVMAALTIAVCIKPVFIPCLVFWTCYVAALIVRQLFRYRPEKDEGRPHLRIIMSAGARRTPLLLLVMLPILIQMGFSYRTTGSVGGWSVGSGTFDRYYFPVVYGYIEGGRLGDDFVNYRDPMAAEAELAYTETAEKVRYLTAHPLLTMRASLFILFKLNITQQTRVLWQTRNMVPYDSFGQQLTRLSRWVNTSIAGLHVIFLILVPLSAFISVDTTVRRFLLLGFALAWLLLGPNALPHWGADRHVALSLPAWASVYSVSAWVIGRRIRPGQWRWSGNKDASRESTPRI